MTERLSNATLGRLPAGVARPPYDRSRLTPGLVHLGVGAFHRAHQAVCTEAALASEPDGALDWGIVGASLRSPATRAALAPQDGLYSLAVRDGLGERLAVVGALLDVLVLPGSAEALLGRMADPATRIVGLTVTEKGYHLDPASGALDLAAPAVAADLASPRAPGSVHGLIVEALRRRRAAGLAPFAVLSSDNLSDNGRVLRRAVLAFAGALDPELARWIEGEAAFPSTMVDRITPATTEADRLRIDRALGLEDAWPVVTEPFSQWVIEDDFPLGRPAWEAGGAVFSSDIGAWERMKLRMLNGAHSAIAYLGQLKGHPTVDAAVADPEIAGLVEGLWAETAGTFAAPSDPAAYARALMARFRNPALGHRTAQIAMDGSQKLPPRLLAPLRDRLAKGAPCGHLTTAVGAWMAYVVVRIRAGGAAALDDPLADKIAARLAGVDRTPAALVGALLSLEAVFGRDLADSETLREALVEAVERYLGGYA
ncbi:fructuronate reductase [Tistlia consotensis]|uniref:Fructuronate reductase n=1 Tax=Tistlia consotensis USBA 355 TaxID=560819 RepID=A0A1Y6C9P3_9PROT|nr:mannitol dehydrogenase family protein [Tistlia consotensis]SMF51952.1 fructuronate reductase [Tistlia consotensis USBA 355]SNR83547.1 fructuronate reductase [Tistlia consotensis]